MQRPEPDGADGIAHDVAHDVVDDILDERVGSDHGVADIAATEAYGHPDDGVQHRQRGCT